MAKCKSWRVFISFMLMLTIMMTTVLTATAAQAKVTEEMVQRGWERIAKADNFKPVPIHYEDSKDPNAWVAFKSDSDYSVHVTRSLMAILNSEAEIAGVLGHELGHIKCGHYTSGVQNNLGIAVVGTILGNYFDRQGGNTQRYGNLGVGLAAGLASSGFSRGQEVEADDYGTDLLARAGYDPMGLYRAMKCFKDNGYETSPSGFNSHPPTDRRLQHLRERAESIKAQSNQNAVQTGVQENKASISGESTDRRFQELLKRRKSK